MTLSLARSVPRRTFAGRSLIGAGLAVVLLALAACSGASADSKAFVTFLQTRILDQPGLSVPRLNEEEKKSLGGYAAHYAVIGDFNEAMSQAFNAASPAIQTMASLTTPQELMEGGERVAGARAALAKVKTQLSEELAKTQARRDALQQDATLKPVYEAAYRKTVLAPSELMVKVVDQTDAILVEAQSFAAFLKANQAKLKFMGTQVEASDPAVLEQLSAHLDALNGKRQQLVALQQELDAMAGG